MYLCIYIVIFYKSPENLLDKQVKSEFRRTGFLNIKTIVISKEERSSESNVLIAICMRCSYKECLIFHIIY